MVNIDGFTRKCLPKNIFFFLKSVWNKEKHVGMIAEGEYKPKEYIYNAEKKIKESAEQMRGNRI